MGYIISSVAKPRTRGTHFEMPFSIWYVKGLIPQNVSNWCFYHSKIEICHLDSRPSHQLSSTNWVHGRKFSGPSGTINSPSISMLRIPQQVIPFILYGVGGQAPARSFEKFCATSFVPFIAWVSRLCYLWPVLEKSSVYYVGTYSASFCTNHRAPPGTISQSFGRSD